MTLLVGLILFILGIVKIFGYFSVNPCRLSYQFDLLLGVLAAVLGLATVINPAQFRQNLIIMLGLLVTINAVFTIQNAVLMRRAHGMGWWQLLVAGILSAAVGVVGIIRPNLANVWIIRLIGIALILDGIQNLVVAYHTLRLRREISARDRQDTP